MIHDWKMNFQTTDQKILSGKINGNSCPEKKKIKKFNLKKTMKEIFLEKSLFFFFQVSLKFLSFFIKQSHKIMKKELKIPMFNVNRMKRQEKVSGYHIHYRSEPFFLNFKEGNQKEYNQKPSLKI